PRVPRARITGTRPPADPHKQGPALALAVAMAILLAEKEPPSKDPPPHVGEMLVAGELALDGRLRPIAGAPARRVGRCGAGGPGPAGPRRRRAAPLPMALAARDAGFTGMVLPDDSALEAAAI